MSLHQYDLPPKWDGRVIRWAGWEDTHVNLCRMDGQREVCMSCGSVARPAVNWGTFYPKDGDTIETLVDVATRRTGAAYLKRRTVPETPHRRLLAFRCTDCRHDYVYDLVTDTWWDLDDADYGPEGSSN